MRTVILIPAYKPGQEFPHFISELVALGVERIVVVDDGSGREYRSRFEEVARHPEVRLCRHGVNLGKGAALKTGMNAVLCDYPDAGVVVTADADGQHRPDDVLAVARFGEQYPGTLVLGARQFDGCVPLRSRFGNEATRIVLRILVGQKLSDTQTGLRAIPRTLLPYLLKLPSRGYEFELDMLLTCRSERVPMQEVPIHTIYLDGNASSHFHPVLDSMRIYFVLLRFALVSLCTAFIDNVVFGLSFLSTGSVAASMAIGRLVAVVFNFATVKRVVFNSRGRIWREAAKYLCLVIVSGLMSFGLIHLFVKYLSLGVLRSKLLAETLLFFVNFLVQRDLIFKRNTQPLVEAESEVVAMTVGSTTAQEAD